MTVAYRLAVCLLAINGISAATAQGLRVETQVYRIEPSPNNGRPVETRRSCVTLFCKGKVYDFVDSADEVIISQPSAERFMILNTARELGTHAVFEEIRHLMASRRKESMLYLRELSQSSPRDARTVGQSLQFELAPSFDTEFDSSDGLLTMSSDSWKYRVRTHEWEDSEQVREYLLYADWISQLNFVLNPSSRFPEPRMLLNKKLQELGRMPTSVELDLNPEQSLTLRADHKFIAGLTADDLHLIQVWDSAAKGKSLRRLSLRSYQEAVLVSQR